METRATSRRLARATTVRVVVDELGDWSRPGPLYRQLAWAIGRAVERGTIAPGARLPSERSLAAALAVSRGTAVAAYDQLVGDGILERLMGSGTFVTGGDTGPLPAGREGSVLVHHLVERSQAATDLIDLSLAVPYDATGLDPITLSTADLAGLDPPSGYSPWGLGSLRAALAAHITAWGLPTEPDQVVVTTGGQQAISVAAACWVRPGDPVAVEATTYPGIIAALTQLGATLVPVAVDSGGMRPDALRVALGAHPVLVYAQSTLQSPTGAVLSSDRRRAIGRLVAAARVPLIEDLALADLAWGPAPPPPIATMEPDATTVVVGSLGKLFWGGLRLGFARATFPVAVRLARIKATHDLGTPAVDQLLGERLLAAAGRTGYPARRRAELEVRYHAMAEGLRRARARVALRRAGGRAVAVGRDPRRHRRAVRRRRRPPRRDRRHPGIGHRRGQRSPPPPPLVQPAGRGDRRRDRALGAGLGTRLDRRGLTQP